VEAELLVHLGEIDERRLYRDWAFPSMFAFCVGELGFSEDTFKFQFTASRACRDKLRQAQDLLRHRIPDGDLATIFEKALDLLIEQVKTLTLKSNGDPGWFVLGGGMHDLISSNLAGDHETRSDQSWSGGR